MTKEELAAKLNGREIGKEITKAEAKQAAESKLLVIFGASDDLCELRGLGGDDEVGCYGGIEFLVSPYGTPLPDLTHEETEVLEKFGALEYVQEKRADAVKIVAKWCAGDIPWTYQTDAPHAAFEIMEDGKVYCRGIVIDMSGA